MESAPHTNTESEFSALSNPSQQGREQAVKDRAQRCGLFRFLRIRFSLRTLLVFTAVVCLLLVWVVKSERQRRTAAQIYMLGGHYCFESEKYGLNRPFDGPLPSPAQLLNDTSHNWYEHYYHYVTGVSVETSPETQKIDWSAFRKLEHLSFNDIQLGTNENKFDVNQLLYELRYHTNLKHMSMTGHALPVSDRGLEYLGRLENLEYLYLSVNGTEEGFKKLRNLRKLQGLLLQDCKLPASTIETIGQFPELTQLSIQFSDPMVEGLPDLAKLQNLYCIDFGFNNLSEKTLSQIAQLKKLKLLCLRISNHKHPGFAQLTKMDQLISLSFYDTVITDEMLIEIGRMSDLQFLHIDSNEVTDKGIDEIVKLKKLETLDLRRAQLTDQGLAKILASLKLNFLDIYFTQVSDEGLRQIANSKRVKYVKLRGSQFSSEVIEQVKKQGLLVESEY